MRILFDQGTPVPLRPHLGGHEVKTAYEKGWSSLSNGDLLRAAEGAFDLLVTTDRNLRYQQNLSRRTLALLVLPTTNWLEIKKPVSKISATVAEVIPGAYVEVHW